MLSLVKQTYRWGILTAAVVVSQSKADFPSLLQKRLYHRQDLNASDMFEPINRTTFKCQSTIFLVPTSQPYFRHLLMRHGYTCQFHTALLLQRFFCSLQKR